MSWTDDMLVERLRDADPLPHDELDRLLRETSVDEMLSRVPPRRPERTSRRVLWGAATAAGVAAVAGVLVVSLPRGEEASIIPGNIGILDRPATDADGLPEWVRGERAVLELGLERDGSRLARETATRRYYIVPADGGRQVCLVDVPLKPPALPKGQAGFGGGPGLSDGGIQCAETAVFERRFMLVLTGYAAGGRNVELVAVVPDGYDRAVTGDAVADVSNNLAVLRPSTLEGMVRVSGLSGERVAHHGFSVGPGPTSPPVPADLDVTVSVFSRPAARGENPPAVLSAALEAARRRPGGPDPEPGTERRVAVAGRTSYWLVRDRFTRRGPRALLAMVTAGGVTLRPIALPTRAQPFRAFPSTLVREPYGLSRITLRTIVPDGFTSATIGDRTFPVRNNFLLIRGFPVDGRYVVDLRGPAGRVVQPAVVGGNESRYIIPTNYVPYRTERVVLSRARTAGLRGTLGATIVAGRPGDVAGLLGPWASTATPSRERTVPVVTVRSGDNALVLVIESALGPDSAVKQRRYRVGELPDLSDLGRVRPLDLTP